MERVPYTPFGREMRITVVEQGMLRKELLKRLGIADSTVSDIIYGRNRRKQTKECIAETLRIK